MRACQYHASTVCMLPIRSCLIDIHIGLVPNPVGYAARFLGTRSTSILIAELSLDISKGYIPEYWIALITHLSYCVLSILREALVPLSNSYLRITGRMPIPVYTELLVL